MNIKNEIVQNSLRCLQHPATWLSIALLLVNDHILKVVCPSWITGKLSDFAGLFFFPFILAAGLSFLLSKYKVPSVRVGQIAFGFVGIWFILLKTIPSLNILTTELSSMLLGSPTKFIMDPTDLIALLSMVPAWIIWRQPSPIKPTYAAYASLIFGSLAVIATSPPLWTVETVTNLEYYHDGIVYAADVRKQKDNIYPIAVSIDGGVTWEEATEVNSIELKSLPITDCGRLNPEICYRLTRIGELQELGPEGEWVKVEDVYRDGYDMILFDWNEQEYVIVAIGMYGIMRRELPDGEWEVIHVLFASTPINWE
jgi:hypothetical protein